MNRRERRARQKLEVRTFATAMPKNDPEIGAIIGALIELLEEGAPETDAATTERKAMALFCACTAYLAHLPPDDHRAKILDDATVFLTKLTLLNEDKLRDSTETEALHWRKTF